MNHDLKPYMNMSLPMSLRRRKSEARYQHAKIKGDTVPLQEERSIRDFKYWRLIDNRFPYDAAYTTSHMLVPKRVVPTYSKLKWRERRELRKLIDTELTFYHQVIENMSNTRSVLVIYHLHLVIFHKSRKDFKL